MKTLFDPLRRPAAAVAVAGALVLAGLSLAFSHDNDTHAKSAAAIQLDEKPVSRESAPTVSFAPVVKKVAPGVVKIVTTTTMKDTSQQFPGFDDPFWRRFFGNPSGPSMPNRRMGPQVERGLGSGVIVSKDGYILTNNHVVDGAKEVAVTLPDGREFAAKVVGRDPKSDVAVVKIQANEDLPVVPMADSSKVQVGDVVLAIGNPFGVGQTVTHGIVSATDRGNMGIEDYEDFIQTDAAINPGNSGGALVDVEGRLIGINTAILSRSGGSQGVGFAIPSNLARSVMQSLIQYGHVTRGYLGVMIQNVTPALAKQFNLDTTKGALIGDVVSGGPAAKAGLKPGDVVLRYDGKPVDDSRRLQLAVAETKPGTNVPVQVLRDGEKKTIEVTVRQLKGNEDTAQSESDQAEDNGTLNGVAVDDIDQQAREQFNIPKSIQGAIVTQVDPNSPAAEAGLKAGDVIQEINHHPVHNANDAVKLTEKTETKQTLVRVWQNGGSHYLVVDESKKAE